MVADVSKVEVQEDLLHYKVHQGDLFFVSDRQTSAAAVEYLLKTGAKRLHFRIFLKTGGKVSIDFLESPSVTVNGTALTAQPFNRSENNPIVSTFFRGPTYSLGTVFKVDQSGFGTSPGTAQAGGTGDGEELVLPANSNYIVKLTPAASTDIISMFEVYETN